MIFGIFCNLEKISNLLNLYLGLMYSNINIHVKCGVYHRIEDYIIQELLTTKNKVTEKVCLYLNLSFILLKFNNYNVLK